MNSTNYWQALDELAAGSEIVLDRPKGSAHPRYPEMIYPLDYGYLQGTSSGDGHEIDCWVGSLADRRVSGIVFTVDLLKRDMEGKVLLGCTAQEMETIVRFQHGGPMSAVLFMRKGEELGQFS